MKYEIAGGAFPIVTCHLENGESMITESGSMVWMTPNIEMQTSAGGLGKIFSRMLSGEKIFQNIYTSRGDGMITFGSSFAGRIMPVSIGPGREMILQKSAFLAAESGVNLSIHFNQRLGAGFFGGEGFILQRFPAKAWPLRKLTATLWSTTSLRASSSLSTPAMWQALSLRYP